MFVYLMATGLSLRRFLDIFTDNYETNDRIAESFYNNLISSSIPKRKTLDSPCLCNDPPIQYCTAKNKCNLSDRNKIKNKIKNKM